jgi:hypothetical protein
LSIHKVPKLIQDLFRITRELGTLFPRPFTPDGHLVGSIGEVVAAYLYSLDLETCSNPGWDARTKMLETVEIKLTGTTRVSLSVQDSYADMLIVLHLEDGCRFDEIYAGKFPQEIVAGKKVSKRRVVGVGLNELRKLNCHTLDSGGRLEGINALFEREPA